MTNFQYKRAQLTKYDAKSPGCCFSEPMVHSHLGGEQDGSGKTELTQVRH